MPQRESVVPRDDASVPSPTARKIYNKLTVGQWMKTAESVDLQDESVDPSPRTSSTETTASSTRVVPSPCPDSIPCPRDDPGSSRCDIANAPEEADQSAIPICLEQRDNTQGLIGSCFPVTLKEMLPLNSRICVYGKEDDIVMSHSPMDFYLLDDLKNLPHSFENKSPLPHPKTCNKPMLYVPATAEKMTNAYTILRQGGRSGLVDKHFGGLDIDFGKLIRFVQSYGESNQKRDSSSSGPKCRIDLGCGGQGNELTANGKISRPLTSFGFDVLDNITDQDERTEILQYLADISDGMQSIFDEVELLLNNELPCNFGPRTAEFGSSVRDRLGALLSRFELFTMQVKNITKGERTDTHTDEPNCSMRGYTKTGALCVSAKDVTTEPNDMYSLKFLFNFRGRVGNYFRDQLGLGPITDRIRYNIEWLDQEFKNMHLEQQKNESILLQEGASLNSQRRMPTHSTFQHLVLNDSSPWKSTVIGSKNGVDVYRDIMTLPAGIVRNYFVSPACTVIYRCRLEWNKVGLSVNDVDERSIEIGVIGGLQTDMVRLYHVCDKKFGLLSSKESVHPSLLLEEEMMNEFGSLTGSSGCKRINPAGIDFRHVYRSDRRVEVDGVTYFGKVEGMNGVMVMVVNLIKKLMDDIFVEMDKSNFHPDKIEELIKATCKKWKPFGVEIGEFRLMIILQVRQLLSCLLNQLLAVPIRPYVNHFLSCRQRYFFTPGSKQKFHEMCTTLCTLLPPWEPTHSSNTSTETYVRQ